MTVPLNPMSKFLASLLLVAAVRIAAADCAMKEAKLAIREHAEADDVAIADFNGDGKLDIAFSEMVGRNDTQRKPAGDVRVFLGNGDGTFGKAIVTAFPVADESWRPSIVAADFNGDRKVDLVLADNSNPSHGPQAYVVLPGKGNGTFGKPSVVAARAVSQFYNVRAADIDGDKKADLVASASLNDSSNKIAVMPGTASGLGKPAAVTFAGKQDIAAELSYRDKFVWELADLDGNGTVSLVAAPAGLASVDFFRDTGAGNYGVCTVKISKKHAFEKPACYDSKDENFAPETVAVADFNGDHHLDIVTGPEEHSYIDSVHHFDVFMNNGKGGFDKKRRPVEADISKLNTFWAIHAEDVTGDGKPDIVAVGSKSGGSDTIALVLPGNGDGTFTSSMLAPVPYEASANAALVRFGALQGAGTLGFAIYAYEGPTSFVHAYSGRCTK